jgi:hypothetical protein
MSMSQEEIEALMNGTALEDVQEDSNEEASEALEASEGNLSEEDEINDILAGIEGIVDDEDEAVDMDDENFDDILASIDNISVDEIEDTEQNEIEEKQSSDKYPLPVENENKVVNQLNEVAADSEQKASQIFDVLSFILDENNEIQNYNKQMAEFIQGQIELLDSLSTKFPNISIFSKHMEEAQGLIETSNSLSSKVDAENNKVFEAMELMQYHDINRQKIERVMAVIRKLNSYLNGIFEDEGNGPEVQVAKHIAGDDREIVDADDIESLINQFSEQ